MSSTQPVVLVVDDDALLARSARRFLERRGYHVETAGRVDDAHRIHRRLDSSVEVVVVDAQLPDGNGLDLVSMMRATDPSVGAVVVTGNEDADVASRAVALGVQGYLLKPFVMSELRVNVSNARQWRILDQDHRRYSQELSSTVYTRTAELRTSRWDTVHRLSLAAEFRDPETGNHLERMSAYSAILARRVGLPESLCEEIRLASPMHDVGKIGIPDEILTYPGRFTPEQRAIMNEHTMIGYRILSGSSSPLLERAASIARSHHEWWNGAGYPDGSRGIEIPLEARIVAIADVFDALTTRRRYKEAFDFDRAAGMMREERETHFDPDLLDVFLGDLDELAFVANAHSDETPAPASPSAAAVTVADPDPDPDPDPDRPATQEAAR